MSTALSVSTIKPPELRKLLGDDVVRFCIDYDRYERHIAVLNESLEEKKKLRPVPRKTCIAAELLTSLTFNEAFGAGVSDPQDVTEEMVEKWLEERSQTCDASAAIHVEEALDRIKFKTVGGDPSGAAMTFFTDVITEFRRGRVLDALKNNPKHIIEVLMNKIQPRALRNAVKRRFNLWDDRKRKNYQHFRGEVTKLATNFADFADEMPSEGKGASGRSKKTSGREEREDDVAPKTGRGGSDPVVEGFSKGKKRPSRGKGKKEGNNRDEKRNKPAREWTSDCLNPKCNGKHPVRKCPITTAEEAEQLVKKHLREKRGAKKNSERISSVAEEPEVKIGAASSESTQQRDRTKGRYQVSFPGGVFSRALGDYGADKSAMSWDLMRKIQATGTQTMVHNHQPKELKPAFKLPPDVRFTTSGKTTLDIRLELPCGPLLLRNVPFLLIDQPMDEALLGRPLLQSLGFDLDSLLEKLVLEGGEVDVNERMNAVYAEEDTAIPGSLASANYRGIRYADQDDDQIRQTDSAAANMGKDKPEEIKSAFETALSAARANGIPEPEAARLEKMFEKFRDSFRIKLGDDPPARLEPYQVTLRENARPFKATQRRYAPRQKAFIESTVRCLEAIGAVRANPAAKWASPALAVPKPGTDSFRFAVDTRGVNRVTIPLASSMPELESCLRSLEGSTVFAKIDFCHAYWQLALALICQEIMSIQTPIGVFTPTRILQGSTDSGNHFQAATSLVFHDLRDNMIQWLDDFLLHARSAAKLVDVIEGFLERCASVGLKVHALKIELYATSVTFCGRRIDKDGITFDPRHLDALYNMRAPTTAADLQQFNCAANWMRSAIPDFAREMGPLHTLLEQCYKLAGKRTRRGVAKIKLHGLWGESHDAALSRVKNSIAQAVKLSHFKAGHCTCLYTDASDNFWSAMYTQVPLTHLNLPRSEQAHEPLAFLSGRFSGHSQRWSTVEKEAYPIVEAMTRCEHIACEREVHIFTDHANLVHIFDPFGANPGMSKQVAHKLMRWAMRLSSFRYVIEHIAGFENVWADMLTRWAAPVENLVRLSMAALLAPIDMGDMDQDWPVADDVINSQKNARCPTGLKLVDGMYCNNKGRPWIPSSDSNLRLRYLITAHAGCAGHRAAGATYRQLSQVVWWESLEADARSFSNSCLHCLAASSTERVPRPLGSALHASRPNEVLHFDYCHLGKSTDGNKYVLIIKDDLSSYTWMFPCSTADAETTADSLLDWMTAFGPCTTWVSDQGTHFQNRVMRILRDHLHIAHHFTQPYCPWTNGTVEVVCRELRKATRALLSELKLPRTHWTEVLPLVQMALNNAKLERLGNRAPITVFASLPSHSDLGVAKLQRGDEVQYVKPDTIAAMQTLEVEKLQGALERMHKDTAEKANRARARSIRAHDSKTGVKECNFREGDFVLRGLVHRHASKLMVRWVGPKRVERCLTEHLFELSDILTGEREVVHGSRVRFFRNRDFEVTEEVTAHLQYQEGERAVVRNFEDIREHGKELQLSVTYKGFEGEEPAWMSLDELFSEVPELVRDYLQELGVSGTPLQRERASKAESALMNR